MVGDDDTFGYVVNTRTGERMEVVAGPGFTLTGEAFWQFLEASGSGWIRPVVGEHMDTGLNDEG
jgi:hypothetical protein